MNTTQEFEDCKPLDSSDDTALMDSPVNKPSLGSNNAGEQPVDPGRLPGDVNHRQTTAPPTDTDSYKRASPNLVIYPPKLVNLAAVKPEPISWLWPGRIALGKLTLVSGDPGVGKSFLTIDVAARVSSGTAWPDDSLSKAPSGSVVMLNAEDGLNDVVRPRLDAAGADTSRVVALAAVQDGSIERQVNLQRDLAALDQAVTDTPNCKLVTIDPITAYLGKCDSHNNADIRAVLAPLSDLAARHHVAVIAISHLNKGSGRALYRTMGSLGFVAAARTAFVMVEEKQLPMRRLFLPIKNNLAAVTAGMAYEIVDGVLKWDPTPVMVSADDVLGDDCQEGGGRKLDAACAWLRNVLAGGQLSSNEIRALGMEAGLSWATIRRASVVITVQANREGYGADGQWFWTLDTQSCSTKPKDAPRSKLGTFDNGERLCTDPAAPVDGGANLHRNDESGLVNSADEEIEWTG